MTTLTQASREWAERPADQRFSSLQDLHAATTKHRQMAKEAKDVPYSTLRVEASDGDVKLIGKANIPASLTHWSFGQLASRIGAPAGYLRGLPATLACQNLNHGLAKVDSSDRANLLLHSNGSHTVSAFLTDSYTRIWDVDITARLLRLTEQNPQWQPAPAAFDGSRGLYASDHDMFAFLVDNDRRIFEKDPNGGLSRGFFVKNSEVGAAAFSITTFLYNYVCGNHMVWGAEGIRELRVRHVGTADQRVFGQLAIELRKYASDSASEDEARIESARSFQIGATKDEVLDRVFGLRVPQLSRKMIAAGYETAEKHSDWYGSPRTAWGLSSGLTEIARDMAYADDRVDLERASGRVLQMAF